MRCTVPSRYGATLGAVRMRCDVCCRKPCFKMSSMAWESVFWRPRPCNDELIRCAYQAVNALSEVPNLESWHGLKEPCDAALDELIGLTDKNTAGTFVARGNDSELESV